MPTSAPADTQALLDEVVRLQRLLHRLKQSPPTPTTVDRSAHLLLLTVFHDGPMRLSDLATAVHVDASTVSRQAAQLVTDGLLERQPHPEDGRASVVALSDSGRDAVEAMIARRRAFLDDTVRDWRETDVRTFTRLLARFVDDTERTYVAACATSPHQTSPETSR